MGPLYRLAVSYMAVVIEFRLRLWGFMVVGELGPLGKPGAVADLGAVRRPTSKWERLVRGVGMPLSWSLEAFMPSNVSGLML